MRKSKTNEKLKKKAEEAVALLCEKYKNAECSLEYGGEPWKLLVMGRLSAQCTDARVNIVCRELFALYPTPRALADAPIGDIEKVIRPCGLFHTKALSLKESCKKLCDEYDGVIPNDMDKLLTFPGVGRKIANLLLGDIYHMPAIVADTHCIRICGRLGFYPETLKDPHKIELLMSSYVEPEEQSDFCHRIVMFGRKTCTARSPKCDNCILSGICDGKNSK